MSHDIQMGFVAADKAWTDSGVVDGDIDPERSASSSGRI